MKTLLLLLLPTFLLAQSPSEKIYNDLISEASFSLGTSYLSNNILGIPISVNVSVSQTSDSLNHNHERSYKADDIEIRAMRFEKSDKRDFFFHNRLLHFFESSTYIASELEEGEDTKIYIQKEAENITEIHMIFKGEKEGSIFSIYGDIEVNELCEITDSFEEGACEHLGNIR